MEDRRELEERFNYIINRDKGRYLSDMFGWRVVLDSARINFDGKVVYIKFHLIVGERYNPKADTASKGWAMKGIFELIQQHYYYIIPEGFTVIFEGGGANYIVENIVDLMKISDRYGDMYCNPSKYIR